MTVARYAFLPRQAISVKSAAQTWCGQDGGVRASLVAGIMPVSPPGALKMREYVHRIASVLRFGEANGEVPDT